MAEILENSDFYATDESDFEIDIVNYQSDSSSDFSSNGGPPVVQNSLNPNDEKQDATSSTDEEDSIPLSRLFPHIIRPVQESSESDVSSSFGNSSLLGAKKKKALKKRPADNLLQSGKRQKTQKAPVRNWPDIGEDCDLETDFPEFVQLLSDAQNRQNYYPIDYFHQYYDETFFRKLTENTNIHFHQSCNTLLNASENEMRCYVGMTLLMSVLGYPRIRMYWSNSFKLPLISSTMSRNRYFKLRNFLHVVNNLDVSNDEKERDKLWKVRPIITSFLNAVLRLPREENVSIDEQMIPFSGKVSIRQYVPRKPNPTGLKNYVLASKNGTILDFEIYQGKTTNFPEDTEKGNLGAGGRAVLRLSESCSAGTNMYFDRYFTSVTLLDKLREKGISGTGTTMSNRFPNVGFPTDYELKKQGRGTIKAKVRDDKNITLIKWMDNKAITMASSKHSVNPIHQCKRYSKSDKRYLNIPQPNVVKHYNQFMGGVDLLNRQIASYRSYHKTNKWPVRVFEHFMDCAVVNSWNQYRKDCDILKVKKNDILDLIAFKMRVAEALIKGIVTTESESEDETFEPPVQKKTPGRPGRVPLPPPEVAKSKALHLPKAMEIKEAQRCRNPGCAKRTRVKCISCNIFLCVVKERHCFIEFHS